MRLRVGGNVKCQQRVLDLRRLVTQLDVRRRLTEPRTRLHACRTPHAHNVSAVAVLQSLYI